MPESFVLLYRAPDRVQANLLAHALENAGIAVQLAGGGSHLMHGAVGGAEALLTDLWVRREDALEGKRVIEHYQKQPADPAPQGAFWVCSQCGEENEPSFELCWQCQAGRTGQ